jgi:energy-coupling factor transporter ATP-binding protein EcfA2
MPLSPTKRSELKDFFQKVGDRVLEPGDPVYQSDLHFKTGVGHDPIEQIATEIDFQSGGGACLFSGQRGTGKSTELKRLAKLLQDQGAVVFYVDLSEYILLTKPIEVSDFLVSVCGALSEGVTALYGQSPADRSYWDRLTAFMGSEVSVTEVGLSVSGANFKAALKTDPNFKEKVQLALRGHVTKLVQDAHSFAQEAVNFVRAKERVADKKVVLILDSVERIRGVGSEAMSVYESVRNLFLAHGESLRIPHLHVVYTVPPYLSIIASGAGTILGGAVVRRLVSTHIALDRSRTTDPAGLEVLSKLVAARFARWDEIFTRAAIDQLSIASGGDIRELFRLIRLCLTAVSDDAQLPLSASAVAHAEVAIRNEMLPIPADHLAWLQRITKSYETCLQSDTDLPTLAHFLDNRLVLNYRNGSDWYDIHPLLREAVDKHVAAQ